MRDEIFTVHGTRTGLNYGVHTAKDGDRYLRVQTVAIPGTTAWRGLGRFKDDAGALHEVAQYDVEQEKLGTAVADANPHEYEVESDRTGLVYHVYKGDAYGYKLARQTKAPNGEAHEVRLGRCPTASDALAHVAAVDAGFPDYGEDGDAD